jgi:hypothetical protein
MMQYLGFIEIICFEIIAYIFFNARLKGIFEEKYFICDGILFHKSVPSVLIENFP